MSSLPSASVVSSTSHADATSLSTSFSAQVNTAPSSAPALQECVSESAVASTLHSNEPKSVPSDVTRSGLVLEDGDIPNNSSRDSRQCANVGCRSPGSKRCVRAYCKKCCQADPLRGGVRCVEHKGTTPQKLREPSRPSAAVEQENAVPSDNEDDPLDIKVTYSRNVQREWQEDWTTNETSALADLNYRTVGHRLVRTEKHYTIIYVWFEDANPAQKLEVEVPHWPFFHPKDMPSLAKKVLDQDNLYWRYDNVDQNCWLKSNRNIRVNSGQTLYIKADHVRVCPGLPVLPSQILPSTPSRKRPGDNPGILDLLSTPSKLVRCDSSSSVSDLMFRIPGAYPVTPRSEPLSPNSKSSSPAFFSPSTPTRSPTASVDVNTAHRLGAPQFAPFTHSKTAEVHSSAEQKDDTPGLLAPETESNGPFPQPLQHAHVDTSFPLMYACDMVPRLRRIYPNQSGGQRRSPKKLEVRWAEEFGSSITIKHTAWFNARKVYTEVPFHIQDGFVAAGRTEEGTWDAMVQWWRAHSTRSK